MTHWRVPENWTVWSERVIDGVSVKFDHLRSFDMQLIKPASNKWPLLKVTIRVVFDCHVVTERYVQAKEGPAYWRDVGGHCRVFDPVRYKQLTCLLSSDRFNLGKRPRLLQLNNTAA
ncbi:hypothetical protein [Burkholderia gladioli]|uniref:hypothetical protein n=1 Tax=Burkholderia gladioli TaxID=28095 RepID=UPI000F523EB7|nr:hypothetical protein [Burkholderia gladioli]